MTLAEYNRTADEVDKTLLIDVIEFSERPMQYEILSLIIMALFARIIISRPY